MKNIFVYIGNHRIKSNTRNYIDKMLKSIKLKHLNVSATVYDVENTKINKCLGCEKCFSTSNCLLDDTDDMKIIKEKMVESDFIILATPIYAINVSANMKVFLDRLSSWAHLLALRGKAGICIATSSGNGVHFTLSYMSTVMSFLGINVIDKYNIFTTVNHTFLDDDFMNKKILEFSNFIENSINDDSNIQTNETLEKIFLNMQKYMKSLEGTNRSEYKYWLKNKMFEFETYSSFLEYEKKKRVN